MHHLEVTLQRAAAFSFPKDIEFDDWTVMRPEAVGGAPDHRQGSYLIEDISNKYVET